ncbi:MAG: hypothetical protein A3H93_03040 [Rhodocyclales bacterium RIFCSPLOWO2_02_FULL_63_24]|nr:MAG: hypothetical protein A3H93_03040 [Rhodocyclales bacterium RIFCSPLOWO2_02_FULL_63_24]
MAKAARRSPPSRLLRSAAALLRELRAQQRQLEMQNQALHESEARFRAMADAAPVLIWMSGGDKGCNWFNQQWLEFTGRTMAQELGNGWAQSVHGDDIDRCLSIYHSAFDQRQRFEMEYRLRRADGKYRWILDRGVPCLDANQEFLGYIGSCIDVTRLKHAEDDLNRAQSVGHIGSWRFDAVNKRITWSRENRRIFGIGEGVPISYQAICAQIHPADVEQLERIWNGAIPDQAVDFEHRLLVGDQVRWVRERGEFEFDAQGRLRGGFGITQDITEIKQARQDLVESEERFRAFMTHSPVASWIVDSEGRYRYVSPMYYNMFKVPTQELVGKRISEIYPPELAEKYLFGNRAAIDAGRPIESIQPGVLPDGSPGEFLVVKFPIRDAQGSSLLCGMALNNTEHRQIVTQLREANERLGKLATEQARHLRELAGELTRAEQRERDRLYELLHDHMQPLLVAVRLSLSSLSTRTPQADCRRIAADANAYISQVIQVARNLSLQLSPPLIRERGLVPALESLCRWVKDNHGLEVELNGDPDAEPEEIALRLLCFNAVRELLMNVVKHAGASRVSLRLRLVEDGSLHIGVIDHGCGFDPAVVTGGSGLAGIERRLGMFGGSLEIASRPGRGTIATLSVPRNSEAAAGQARKRDAASG